MRLAAGGQAQAEALARRMAELPLRAVYASPLERAQETASAIAWPHRLPVRSCEGAAEVEYGEWTGRRFGELEGDHVWRDWNAQRSVARPPGGETMAEVQHRIVTAVGNLAEAHGDEHVALVSHGDVIRAALMFWLGTPIDLWHRLEIDLASRSLVEIGPWSVVVRRVNEIVELP